MSLSDKIKHYATWSCLSEKDVKQFIKLLKKSFICNSYPGIAGKYGNYALEEKMIKEFNKVIDKLAGEGLV